MLWSTPPSDHGVRHLSGAGTAHKVVQRHREHDGELGRAVASPGVATPAVDPRPLPSPPLRAQPGQLRRLFKDPQPLLDELRAGYGPIVALGAGPVRMAIIGDPAALRELFGTSPEAFRWGHKFNVLGFRGRGVDDRLRRC